MRPDNDEISVLVVEDDRELLDLYAQYLRSEFVVVTAIDGAEALDRMGQSIDVVLLDRQMPGMSGDEVVTELRDRGYNVPVAMVTAVEPDPEIVNLPFDEYLLKPINPETLIETTRVLARRASFEQKSRAFFRIASKKASLETGEIDHEESDEYDALIKRMKKLRSELDETIRDVFEKYVSSTPRSTIDTADVQSLLTEIHEHPLPDELATLIDDYQTLRTARPPFMWKWVHRLAPQNTLPCVDQRFTEAVPVDKTITILFVTLLDDILEKRQDRPTFDEIAKIPSEQQNADPTLPDVDTEYVSFAQRVWDILLERIQRGPHYENYEELFRYDIEQAINSIEYSDLAITRPDLTTMDDLERYESHNMAMFAYADIDLMHSPIDVRDDLPTLREVIWTAQLMARIGNWVSTWEREFREGDYSSGVVVSALEEGVVSREEIAELDGDNTERTEACIDRIKHSGIERELLTRWELNHHRLRDYDDELSRFDLGPFIDGTEEVLRYHLSSTGLK
jgi:DNA-binding response OmpR family regulator